MKETLLGCSDKRAGNLFTPLCLPRVSTTIAVILLAVGNSACGNATDTGGHPQPVQATAPAVQVAPAEPAVSGAPVPGADKLAGTWANSVTSVIFPNLVLRTDGTATTTNYGGVRAEGTWNLNDNYFVVKAGDETMGSMIRWVSDNEFKLDYTKGSWLKQ